MLLRENEIALFRYRKRLLAGVCVTSARDKVRFALSAKDAVNVPVENVLLGTGQIASDLRAGPAWFEQAEKKSAQIVLDEIWELVREEETAWPLSELADLYYGDEADAAHQSALLLALENSAFFEADGRLFRPANETTVAELQAAEVREREREAERERFCAWFHGDGAGEVEWIEPLKDVALHGDQSAQARWVERMLDGKITARQAFDRLVRAGVWDAHEFLELMREEVPTDFAAASLEAVDVIGIDAALEDSARQDLTHLDAVTIDDASTTDMDDAVSVRFYEDGGFQVGIHITDVAALIVVDSVLDREALSRGASLYTPDQKIPMLPSALSEGLGSLVPGEDRLAVSVLFDVDTRGGIGAPTFARSVIRCREKLSYDDVDAMLDDMRHPRHAMLSALFGVAEEMLVRRMQNGAVVVSHADRMITVSAGGEVDVQMRPRNSRADLLVSELMVMANAEIARACAEADVPLLYRVQHTPDLSEIPTTDHEQLYRYRVLTKMRPANTSQEPGPHGGLGMSPYCQASSPLRRFMDLIAQRQFAALIAGQEIPYTQDDLTELSGKIDTRMRLISQLERRRNRYWLYQFFTPMRGREFEAIVLDTRDRSCRVEILEYALHTDVRLTRAVTPGDMLSVRLTRVDAWGDDIQFVMG